MVDTVADQRYNVRVNTRAQNLFRQALELDTRDRAELAVELIASIDGSAEPDALEAWADEIERRAARALAGETTGDDWKNVRARIEGNLRAG